jgi:hypothetical protein
VLGANRTLTVHVAPGASVNPVVQVVLTSNAGPVAGCPLTSVNDQGASPQLVTVAVAVVLLPTDRLPNMKVSALVQIRPPATASVTALPAPSKSARLTTELKQRKGRRMIFGVGNMGGA